MSRPPTRPIQTAIRTPKQRPGRRASRADRRERELAVDLAALVRAGLIAPTSALRYCDARLRFAVTELGELAAHDHLPTEEVGRCELTDHRRLASSDLSCNTA